MKVVLFYHSLLSDWNHSIAHFLRGVARELKERGHEVVVYEPAGNWSLSHLLAEHGEEPIEDFRHAYPGLDSIFYRVDDLNLDTALAGANAVVVHKWNDPALIRAIGAHHKTRGGYTLFFHDTHHRSVTEPDAVGAYDLSGYDGVLAYGAAIARIYKDRGWAQRVWIWHEAADVRLFYPIESAQKHGDVVWIGNWGDDERIAELEEFLLEPAHALGLKTRVYGVRYPAAALAALADAGIEYGGWLPNYRVPEVFARYRVTVQIHRRPYALALPGIPTIRPFEALACAIPLVCSPWRDTEGLFTAGKDFLVAADGAEMKRHLRALLDEPERAAALAAHGRATILKRHTTSHRVDQWLAIVRELTRGKPERLRFTG